MRTASTTLRALVRTGTALAVAGTLHQLVNERHLRTPADRPPAAAERVTVLLPARDEAHRIAPTVRSLLAQTGVPDLEVLVLDDSSTDGTADVVRAAAAGDPRLRVLTGTPPPPGVLGKPHACAQLAAAATGTVLVCVDADVELAPHAVAAGVALLRGRPTAAADAAFDRHGAAHPPLDLLTVWPRQLADGAAARLVQPLQVWSWLVTLPLRRAERSRHPGMVAACGQFLLVDATALVLAGGFAAVGGEVLDDMALARSVRRAGGRVGLANGASVAECRMYSGWAEVSAGYEKSMWSAFGSPAGALAIGAGLALVYVVPPVAALTGSRAGALGWAAAVASRLLAARTTRSRTWPDALGHPVSIATLLTLLVRSYAGRRGGRLLWKGRPV